MEEIEQEHEGYAMVHEPATQILHMRCRDCRFLFDGSMLTNVSFEVAAASMKDNRCPSCGAGWKKLLLGLSRSTGEDASFRAAPPGSPVSERAADWLARGETGLSSQAIHGRMTGGRTMREHPRDAADLHRCMLLLYRIPEWEADIALMADCSPEWARVVAAWPELAATFREEAGPDYARWPRPRTAAALDRALADPAAS
jgi:hypothetical protein